MIPYYIQFFFKALEVKKKKKKKIMRVKRLKKWGKLKKTVNI